MDRITLNARSESVSLIGSHPTGKLSGPPGAALTKLALATAMALLVIPTIEGAQAQTLGALDVRSRLGERFYGAVPVQAGSGFLDPNCVRVLPNPNAPAGAEALRGTRVRVGSADTLIIETNAAVTSPVVGLRVELGCERPTVRDYVVLGEGATIAGLTDAPPAASAIRPSPQPRAASPAARTRSSPPRRAAIAQAPKRPAPAVVAEVPTAPAARAPLPREPVTVAPSASSASAPSPGLGTAPSSSQAPALDNAERRVAELRARSDDQAAALLALDDRLALLQKQAEVLKLQLEQALVTPTAAAAATAAMPPASVTASAAASAQISTPAGGASPAAADAKPAAATSAASTVSSAPSQRKEPGVLDLLSNWGVAGGLAALLVGAFILRRRRRPIFKAGDSGIATSADDSLLEPQYAGIGNSSVRSTAQPARAQPARAQTLRATPVASAAREAVAARSLDQTAEWIAPPPTDTMPTAAAAADAGTSREFHITQQFGPTDERVVATAQPEEIVQQARTHYMDDGDVFRAIDLLEMAVSARKDSARPWQALFAIYHRERMTERFQRLAMSYRDAFGEDPSWPTIQALGLAIDPYNKLYGDETTSTALAGDLTERWLGVPLDFTAHLLANEMHDQLMSTQPGQQRRKRTAQ